MESAEQIKKQIESLPWWPLPGPQMSAFMSPADITFYGGAAGGGKTDLLLGLALTQHKRSIIFRREYAQIVGIVDRMAQILGTRQGYNGQDKIWRGVFGGRQVEFGSCPHPGNEQRYQGRDHDLIGFDEITHFMESQFRFLSGWLRSTDHMQRTRILCTGNPPTSAEGRWVINYWGPWLDPKHSNPAQPGELRYFSTIAGKDVEVDSPEPFIHRNETITPQSRTFIPSKILDNPYLANSGYLTQLQALPEPLRSQLLYGDFTAGIKDADWQVIPTVWVQNAMERWQSTEPLYSAEKDLPISALGVDPARGGGDKSIVAFRHNWRFAPLREFDFDNGRDVAAKVLEIADGHCPIYVDAIGIGASVIDHLESFIPDRVTPVIGSEKSSYLDRTSNLKFANVRAELWWRMREILSPDTYQQVALPPDQKLLADLTAPTYKLTPSGIKIEDKASLAKRLGRSPDRGDAVVYCAIDLPLPLQNQKTVSVVRIE